ncbi:SRPBCC family protein [Alcaligenes faecalis]|uniref:SRPBCC family protein n=1 Tax=Alcaligenes faecalis TaxID=511 RepID=UPI0009C0BAE0|nr:SRPBCC family protein [Alcaligenes faecalis]ARP54865.1 carbon monoxide dehydrogenase [Alcaligenes faecalis]MBH0311022.1 SRPBCC family protein [Alcaligenes faecalis]USP47346.1 SRPBCC family protein [Alcaligenes faecalis]
MNFKNRFHIPLPLDQAWALMLDVPRIMPCLPGAKLTDVLDGNKYQGSVSIKLGPIKLSFDGTAELVNTDEENHIAYLRGAGLDPKGRGSASSDFSFALTPSPEGGTDVEVSTELTLSGAVAQYGRGSGMIAEVAGQILGQFERNLARMVRGDAAPAQGADIPAPPNHPGMTAAPGGTAINMPPIAATPVSTIEAQAILYQSQAVLAQTQQLQAQMQQTLLRLQARGREDDDAAGELNMLSIGLKAFWSQIRYRVGRLFGRKDPA